MGMTIAIDKLYMNKMPNSCKECPLTYLDTGDDAYFGANERRCVIDDSCVDGMGSERAYDCPLIEAIPKNQYEARLKADMAAMLTEIQLELDEMKITKVRSAGFAVYSKDPFRRGVNCSKKIIQEKINALKENENGNK